MPLSASLQSTYTQNPAVALLGQTRRGAKETTFKNAAGASVPIGSPVVYKPSAVTSDLDAALPANSTDLLVGVVAHSDDYAPAWTDLQGNVHGELDSTGIVAGAMMSVVREGWVWVKCHTGCTPGQRLFVSTQSAGAYSAAGQLGNVTATNAIDATTKGEWKSTQATPDGGAWLELDAINK